MPLETLAKLIPSDVRQVCSRLNEAGFHSWVVGGCVRDTLLAVQRGHTVTVGNDWDIATTAKPEQVVKAFRRVIPTGIEHGTVTVMVGKVGYEVTTLRAEAEYSDGRRPDAVAFVDDIKADLARRDFTVNAMAFDPLTEMLIDPFDGRGDLASHVLRAVGDPAARFGEDGLRVLRAARFVATLELELDPETARAIEPSLGSYRKVSAERIRDEWTKTMKARRPSRAFEVMRSHGMLGATCPELMESVGCEQNRYHAYDVWGHAMECLDHCPPSVVLRVAGLLHDVGKPRSREMSDKTGDYTFYRHEAIGADMARAILSRLRFSGDETDRVVALIQHHLICYEAGWSDAAVRRWVRRVGPDLVEDLCLLGRADANAKGRDAQPDIDSIEALVARVQRLIAEGAALSVRDLAINGGDLVRALGLAPGPLFGSILRELLEEVTDSPERNERDILLGRAAEIAQRDVQPAVDG